jgi:arginase
VAAKIARQTKKIVLLGAPMSAAALSQGHESAPSALRSAGLTERLKSIGYEVSDLGDDPVATFRPDDENPRTRNLAAVAKALEAFKPKVEQAVKTGALPVILAGDCSVALATVAGMRRYFKSVSMIYMDRDADLNTPATTPSGCLDGMVVSHLTGRGAPELVRPWGEPPLVRESALALFGVDRFDAPEEESLRRSTLHVFRAADIRAMGPAKAARTAIDHVHGGGSNFVLHFDVDVIGDFAATNFPGNSGAASGGLTAAEIIEAMKVFAAHPNLGAIEITAYNPAKDTDGKGVAALVDLLAEALQARSEALTKENASPSGAELPKAMAPAGDAALSIAPSETADSVSASDPAELAKDETTS